MSSSKERVPPACWMSTGRSNPAAGEMPNQYMGEEAVVRVMPRPVVL